MTTLVKIRKRLKDGFPYSLLELLNMTRHHRTIGARDRIFSLFSLDGENHAHSQMAIDYALSVEQVYINFAAYWLHRSRNLDLLSFAGAAVRHDFRLPTWVPSLGNLNMRSLDPEIASQPIAKGLQRLYNATSTTFASPEFAKHNTVLNLSGVHIGVINKAYHYPLSDLPLQNDQIIQWKELMKISAVSNQYRGKLENEVFWRTLLADQDFNNCTGPSRLNRRKIQEIRNNDTHRILASHTQALQCSLYGRIFMTSECGYVGLCPQFAESGDLIVLLHGGRMPYIIRPVYNSEEVSINHYELIGEA
jgi:hypothetical protein